MRGLAEILRQLTLKTDCSTIELDGLRIAVLALERLIAVKEKLTRPKDLAMLLVLRATLEERQRSG